MYFALGGLVYYCVIFLLITSSFRRVHTLSWLQVKIVWFDVNYECFRHSCSDTTLRFVVKESTLEHSFNWPISFAGLLHPVDAHFVPNEAYLNFTVEVAGRDPTYRFPRVCDTSEIEELPVPSKYASVFPRGKCFNATVHLQRSYDAPGEKYAQSHQFANGSFRSDYPLIATSHFFTSISPVPVWVVFILAALNVVLLVSLVTVMYLSRRNKRDKEALTEFELAVSRTASEETRYEMPWEQKYRPLPSYLKELQEKKLSALIDDDARISVVQANV